MAAAPDDVVEGMWATASDDIWFGYGDGTVRHYNGSQIDGAWPAGIRDLSTLWGVSGEGVWVGGASGEILRRR